MIVVSRDVIFDEENFWLWNNNTVGQQISLDFHADNEVEQHQDVTE